MTRDVIGVLTAMENQIPENFEYRDEIYAEFKKIKDSVPFTAPEVREEIRLDQAAEILKVYVPYNPAKSWHKTMADILYDKVNFEDYMPEDRA